MTSTQNTTWPEGVIARYLTVGGATVDVIDDATDNRPAYNSTTHTARGVCTGELCPETFAYGKYTYDPDIYPMEDEDFRRCVARVGEWAQSHAEKCRAMPKPDGTR